MARETRAERPDVLARANQHPALKFIRDMLTILEMRLIIMRHEWYWHIMGTLVFPLSIFYWSRALAPDDPNDIRRLMIGALIFGISLQTVNVISSNMINDRFQGKLKLLITMPISKAAYAFGMIGYVSVQTIITVTLLLTIGWLVGVQFTVSWSFVPLIAVLILTMAGITLFIASYAPSAETGSIMSNVFGILLVMISPVFFTIDRAPLVLKWLGMISPLRYAADGMAKSLAGNADVLFEMAILAGFAIVTLGTGLWKLRWRES